MSSPRNISASVLMACATALAATGCHAPWSIPSGDTGRAKASPSLSNVNDPATPVPAGDSPPAPGTPPPATDADIAGVLDKLPQIDQLDPEARQRLVEKLRATDPKFWPATAEQFRASLVYHQELVASEALKSDDSEMPPVRRRRPPDARLTSANSFEPNQSQPGGSPAALAADLNASRAVPAPPYRIPTPPSTPLSTQVDPRHADADGISTEALAHASPSAQNPPRDALVQEDARDAAAPARFEATSGAIPIGAASRKPNDERPATTSAVPAAFAETASPAAPLAAIGSQSTVDKNWQQLVDAAADDLSQRVAESPANTAEIHQHVSLRLLRLLAGETEAALEPIPHIAPAEQDYWSRQIFALATYLDHHAQPDGKRRAAASVIHLDEAVANLRDIGALSLRNFAFCKNIYGYGAIEAYKDDRFSAGQQVSLYVEVENYHSQSTDKGFTTKLGSTYEILDEKGERVDGGEFPDVDDCCSSRRRDFHIQFGLKLPAKIAAGRYQLELVVRDRQSDKLAHATAQFEIRGPVVSPPPKPAGVP